MAALTSFAFQAVSSASITAEGSEPPEAPPPPHAARISASVSARNEIRYVFMCASFGFFYVKPVLDLALTNPRQTLYQGRFNTLRNVSSNRNPSAERATLTLAPPGICL